MKKVSVIVPVYNGEKVLQRCVDSILNQDYKNIEVILIDDGSRDASYEIMQKYALADERVRAVHQENQGVSATRNHGLELATGDYIQFVDVDDYLPYESIKLMAREMEENPVQMVIADFYRVANDTISQKGSIQSGGILTRREYAEKMLLSPADFYYGVLWNKMYQKEIIEKYHIIMDPSISYSEDMIFNLEYLLHVNTVSVLKAPVYYYVKTEGSLVDQNMKLSSVIKMKTSVIRYYNNFYKNILDEEDYESRRPIIYGYLLSFSTDGFTLPLLNDTSKLRKEQGKGLTQKDGFAESILYDPYLSLRLVERYLTTISKKYALSLNETKVLYYLYLIERSCTLEELSDFSSVAPLALIGLLTKLTTQRFINAEVTNLLDMEKTGYSFRKENEELARDFADLKEDYRTVLFEGMAPEERDAYDALMQHIRKNLENVLK